QARAHARGIPAPTLRTPGAAPHGGEDVDVRADGSDRPGAHAPRRNHPRPGRALRPHAGGSQSRSRPPGTSDLTQRGSPTRPTLGKVLPTPGASLVRKSSSGAGLRVAIDLHAF